MRLKNVVTLPLDDPLLAEHAQQIADFARQHRGRGHELHRVNLQRKGHEIACSCGHPVRPDTPDDGALALMEDELIDDG